MRRRLLLLSTIVVLSFALATGIEAALADVPQLATATLLDADQVPACGGPPCGAGVKVLKDGTGSGTVTSVPAGIDCGPICARGYPWGAPVTLTANPAAGSAFSGWSYACTGTGTCKVLASSSPSGVMTTATATFTLISHIPNTLRVSRSGPAYAGGSVTSVPAGIDCPASCVSEYPLGTSVTLNATPFDGSTFTGWSGACTGTGTCNVTIGAQTGVVVTANFTPMCVVPNVKGMTLAAAERRIKSQDCSIGRITRDASRTVREQHVIAQKPKAGAQLKYQAKVNLLVSKGGH